MSKRPSGFLSLFLLAATCAGATTGGELKSIQDSYAKDAALVQTTVDITSINAGLIPLREVFFLIEKQTSFKFVYLSSQLPLDTRVALEAGLKISLSDLFFSLTLLTDVVFQRHDQKIIVRNRRTRDLLSYKIRYTQPASAVALKNNAIPLPGQDCPECLLWT